MFSQRQKTKTRHKAGLENLHARSLTPACNSDGDVRAKSCPQPARQRTDKRQWKNVHSWAAMLARD
ncbi:hypothetical protein CO609_02425 [Lysobacteraceae bacterium NML91-0268]|nr:hypothetical protein CO609_02425 [Xanthomonadaceae bacterium NML91-0268]